MHLRHIRPGSEEWLDAISEELEKAPHGLSPEEVTRLRAVDMADRAAREQKLSEFPWKSADRTARYLWR